jgi:hypothetical protein
MPSRDKASYLQNSRNCQLSFLRNSADFRVHDSVQRECSIWFWLLILSFVLGAVGQAATSFLAGSWSPPGCYTGELTTGVARWLAPPRSLPRPLVLASLTAQCRSGCMDMTSMSGKRVLQVAQFAKRNLALQNWLCVAVALVSPC